MTNLIYAIMIGIGSFPLFAVLFTLPIVAVTLMKYKSVNFVRIGINYAMLLYFLCVIALVIFPLPSAELAASLSTYDIQLVPFRFVADIVNESPFILSNPSTYLPTVFHQAVLQVVLNILMTIPFGMFLRYYCGCSGKKVVLLTCLLSLAIEITQFTGLYGIYNGSYRLCDVDDLMTNTLGGYLGYRFIYSAERFLPSIQAFNMKFSKYRHAYN